jgi:hypothetical protein
MGWLQALLANAMHSLLCIIVSDDKKFYKINTRFVVTMSVAGDLSALAASGSLATTSVSGLSEYPAGVLSGFCGFSESGFLVDLAPIL